MRYGPQAKHRTAAALVVSIVAVPLIAVVAWRQRGDQSAGPTPSDIPLLLSCLTELPGYHVAMLSEGDSMISSDDIEIGAFTQLGAFSDDFYAMRAQDRLLDEIERTDTWIAPMSVGTRTMAALLVAMDRSDDTYYCHGLLERAVGEALGELHASDILLWDPATNGHFRLRDRLITPIDDRARKIVPSTASLEALQTILHERASE